MSKSLAKLSTSDKIQYVNHSLNRSPTKNVPSFHQNQRFLKLHYQSPNKFYDIPNSKSLRSTSFGYGTKTNFAKKNFIDPGQYNITSSFNKRKNNGPSFSISRQEYYKGRSDYSLKRLAPGMYNPKEVTQLKFYMGRRISLKQKVFPGPGQYNLSNNIQESNKRLVQKLKHQRVKTQYQDNSCKKNSLLKSMFRDIPGPGSYQIDSKNIIALISKTNISNSFRFSKQPRLKIKDKLQKIGPGSYQIFSEFCNPESN